MALDIKELLRETVTRGASDLYLKTGSPPTFRVNGVTEPMDCAQLTADEVDALIAPLLGGRQQSSIEEEHSANMAVSLEGVGRFRVIVFQQQSSLALVARHVVAEIPTVTSLRLPLVLDALSLERTGLILVTGPTGSGKSTTLAAMIGHRNATMPGHIVCVEEPIEFVHHDRRSLVTQREIGVDCDSVEAALKDALRQAPDVLLLGEIRDRRVMEQALSFAETGHLVFATLHSANANQALERVLGFFPPEAHGPVLVQLGLALKAIVSQRLLPTLDGSGRIAAAEVLVATERARELVRQGDIAGLKQLMRTSHEQGMITFDESLYELARQGLVSPEAALAAADSPADLRLRFRGFQSLSVR